MWITFKTAFFERKVTLQYPCLDVLEGKPRDLCLFPASNPNTFFEPLMGAGQTYKGPLNTRISDRYRGLLDYKEKKCISCLRCARACPIDVITVKAVKVIGPKTKVPVTFRIDYSKCMFCGLCVEVCPTDAIFFSRRFEGATFDYRTLIKEFIGADGRRSRLRQAEEAKGEETLRAEKKTL